jgi:uncharacterized protein (TIGR03382 family)
MRAVLVVAVLASTAHAHVQLTYPMARTTEQKTGPCGAAGSTRGTNVTTFQPGETITVTFDETVDHPGHYRIAFDDDGNDVFQNPNNPNDNFASTLVEPILDKTGGVYSQTVTLPTTPCDNCTLQLIQVMTTSVPYNSFYYQCADITIAGDPPEGSGSGGPPEVEGGCSTTNVSGGGSASALVGLALLFRRRRRR